MQLKRMAVFAAAALGLAAMVGAVPAGADSGTTTEPDRGATTPQSVGTGIGPNMQDASAGLSASEGGEPTDGERFIREWLKDNQPISQEEMDRRMEAEYGNVFVHYYPGEPDDLLMEPPPFDDDGDPIVESSGD